MSMVDADAASLDARSLPTNKADTAIMACDPPLSLKCGQGAIYGFPSKAQLLGDEGPRTV